MMKISKNLKYRFHKIGFYVYAVKYNYYDYRKKSNRLLSFVKSLFYSAKIFSSKYGYYEYLEIPITTKCSLRCKNCSNIIPYYKNPGDYDLNILLESIKVFLQCIDHIVYVRVLGGEPFVSKNLYSVLSLLVKSPKIQKVEVVTNGTIVPSGKRLIRLLRNEKITVCISKYPMVRLNRLVDFLENNSIHYRIEEMKYWMNYGKPFKRNKSVKELKKQFATCNHVCKSLVNGQVHLCPRSSHGTDLGIIQNNSDDYLDLLDHHFSIEEKRVMLNKLFRKKYVIACDYCDFGTKKSKKIPVAEQLK